jgi:hypothetical protein
MGFQAFVKLYFGIRGPSNIRPITHGQCFTFTETKQTPKSTSSRDAPAQSMTQTDTAQQSLHSRTESNGEEHEVFPFPACLTWRSTDRLARPDSSAPSPETADNPTPFPTKGEAPPNHSSLLAFIARVPLPASPLAIVNLRPLPV